MRTSGTWSFQDKQMATIQIEVRKIARAPNLSARVSFPAAKAGTSPEGHEEARARHDHAKPSASRSRPYLGKAS